MRSPRQARKLSVARTSVSAKPMTIAVSTSACGSGSALAPSVFAPSSISGGAALLIRPAWKMMMLVAVVSSDSPSSSRTRWRDRIM